MEPCGFPMEPCGFLMEPCRFPLEPYGFPIGPIGPICPSLIICVMFSQNICLTKNAFHFCQRSCFENEKRLRRRPCRLVFPSVWIWSREGSKWTKRNEDKLGLKSEVSGKIRCVDQVLMKTLKKDDQNIRISLQVDWPKLPYEVDLCKKSFSGNTSLGPLDFSIILAVKRNACARISPEVAVGVWEDLSPITTSFGASRTISDPNAKNGSNKQIKIFSY